jgi:hypothetical protein
LPPARALELRTVTSRRSAPWSCGR